MSPAKPQISLRVASVATTIAGVATPPPYVALLMELAAVQADLRRLETQMLRMMRECGITDEAISDVMNISPQAVGKRRRRRV